jgi:hypothetical protein
MYVNELSLPIISAYLQFWNYTGNRLIFPTGSFRLNTKVSNQPNCTSSENERSISNSLRLPFGDDDTTNIDCVLFNKMSAIYILYSFSFCHGLKWAGESSVLVAISERVNGQPINIVHVICLDSRFHFSILLTLYNNIRKKEFLCCQNKKVGI